MDMMIKYVKLEELTAKIPTTSLNTQTLNII